MLALRRRLRVLVPSQWRHEHERGSMSVETIIIFPAFVIFLFLVIQGALWYQARSTAQAAASTTLDAARVYQASESDGVTAGNAFLRSHTTLHNTAVQVHKTDTTVTVTITGSSTAIVPGLSPAVSTTLTGPAERWVG